MSQATKYQPMPIDVNEYGATQEGEKQFMNRRLFFQLQVFTGCIDTSPLIETLKASGLEAVLYKDVNDARGVGVLFMEEDPEIFVTKGRDVLNTEAFRELEAKPEFTMLGRTYGIGREQDLEDFILKKPKRNALNPDLKWAVWYPLRRKPEFALLDKVEHGRILGEHAVLGMSYAAAGLAWDVRLACHGIDKNDNEFVIGLLGPNLHPLSKIVQDMRKTQQTSKYIQNLGPFFVGHVAWQSEIKS